MQPYLAKESAACQYQWHRELASTSGHSAISFRPSSCIGRDKRKVAGMRSIAKRFVFVRNNCLYRSLVHCCRHLNNVHVPPKLLGSYLFIACDITRANTSYLWKGKPQKIVQSSRGTGHADKSGSGDGSGYMFGLNARAQSC